MMRTTLSLDEDVLDLARSLADSQKIAIGKAVSILIRRGAQAESPILYKNGFPVASMIPEGTPQFGLQDIESALESEDAEIGAAVLRPAAGRS